MFVVIADHVFNDMVGDGNVKLFCSMFSKEENVCSPIGFAFGDIIFHQLIKCHGGSRVAQNSTRDLLPSVAVTMCVFGACHKL